MSRRTFVGFGFGAIQSGLFLLEAHRSGNFDRLVVAEIIPELVGRVRQAGGYHINVATDTGTEDIVVDNVEIFNPLSAADREPLIAALAEASEIATALPSVDFYQRGDASSVVELLAQALRLKSRCNHAPPCVIYTAENHNHAAEILQRQCEARLDDFTRLFARESAQFLNTVIGKMSGVVEDSKQIHADGLACLVENYPRAFLVEAFNRILITQIRLPGFRRRIEVFLEKPDLLPFKEAKLYGHNAVHALLGFLAHRRGHQFMSTVVDDHSLLALARAAFIEESGGPLVKRYAGVDPLFTHAGWRAYAEDLLARMTHPHLRDRTERVIRDPRRKLRWDDRLIGAMRLALEAGVTPRRFALGAAAAAEFLDAQRPLADQLNEIWAETGSTDIKTQLIRLVAEARLNLKTKEDV